MKPLLTLILLAACLAPTARADAPAVHGMLVFGRDRVYISHLPMFHAPHAYQLIASIELPPDGFAAYKQSRAAHPEETIYTLVPERFDLPGLVAHPHPIQADLYRGHFERGGEVIASGLTVNLGTVLFWRKFVPGEAKPQEAHYLLFGTPGDAYLAHRIVSAPDFDHVLEVKSTEATVAASAVQELVAPSAGYNPVQVGAAPLPFRTADGSASQSLTLGRELYLETGDLAQ